MGNIFKGAQPPQRLIKIINHPPPSNTRQEIHLLKRRLNEALHCIKAQQELFRYFRPGCRPPPRLLRIANTAERILEENQEAMTYMDLTSI